MKIKQIIKPCREKVSNFKVREFIKSCYEMLSDYAFVMWVIMMLSIGLFLLENSKG